MQAVAEATLWLGHATLQMTMDVYGHLWTDPEAEQATASALERQLKPAR